MSPNAYDDWLGRTDESHVPIHVRALLHRPSGASVSRVLLVAAALLVGTISMAGPASATWSVVGTDPATGQIGAAVASCVDARDLTTTMALVPSVGGAVSVGQATDSTPIMLTSALRTNPSPRSAMSAVQDPAVDPSAALRQYGVAMIGAGASAVTGASVTGTTATRTSADGRVTVQGNLLASPAVVDRASRAYDTTTGPLATRLLAALDAGSAAGGDRGCGAKARSAALVVVGSSSALFVPAATAANPTDASTKLLAAQDLTPAELANRLGAQAVLPAPRGARAPLVYLSTVVAPGDDALAVLDARYTAQVAASQRRTAPAASDDIVGPSISPGLTLIALVLFGFIGLVVAALIIAGLRRADRRAAAARAADEDLAATVRRPYRGEVMNLFDLDLTASARRRRDAERNAARSAERTRESVWSGSSW